MCFDCYCCYFYFELLILRSWCLQFMLRAWFGLAVSVATREELTVFVLFSWA